MRKFDEQGLAGEAPALCMAAQEQIGGPNENHCNQESDGQANNGVDILDSFVTIRAEPRSEIDQCFVAHGAKGIAARARVTTIVVTTLSVLCVRRVICCLKGITVRMTRWRLCRPSPPSRRSEYFAAIVAHEMQTTRMAVTGA